jgi:hypothetical protein
MPAADFEIIFCATCKASHGTYDCPADPFGAPEVIPTADLRVGDFVLHFHATTSIRGTRVNSAVREISAPQTGRWVQRAPRQRGGTPILSRRIAFQSRELSALNVPVDHPVTVRRLAG